jgi:uncharacterized membrane protein
MKFQWKVEVPQWIVLAAMFAAGAIAWPNAPERIPAHWNISGQVDRYGGKFEGLLLMPLIALGIYVLMLVLPRIDPGRANYARFAGAYTVIRMTVLGIFALFYTGLHVWLWTGHLNIAQLAPIVMGLLAIVLGTVLGKIRPNWFVGIRTPWTLSSKMSWGRTHRAGGWVFVSVGLATIVSAFIGPRVAFWVLIGGLVGGTVALIVYSYLVWRQDPDKLPPAGTLPAD